MTRPRRIAHRREATSVADGAAIRDQAIEVARGWSGPGAPAAWALTAALFRGLADSPELLGLAGRVPPERLPALVFVASVHAVVRDHPDDPFAAYFPAAGRGARPVDQELTASYRRFCLDHAEELAAAGAGRTYQMNEVARCAPVALALAELERETPGRRVGLVDVGTGAGLGLFPDRYGYRFGDGTTLGDPASPVQIRCDVSGDLLPLDPSPPGRRLPTITKRIGIDLQPVDLADESARAWLAACIPPEPGAIARFTAAATFVAADPPHLVAGDATEVLPSVLAELAPHVDVIVVVDTFTAVFFPPDRLERFAAVIRSASHTGGIDVTWVSLDPLVPLGTEARRTVHGVEAPQALVDENRAGGVFGVLSVQTGGAGAATRLLATAHPSGTRLRWLV